MAHTAHKKVVKISFSVFEKFFFDLNNRASPKIPEANVPDPNSGREATDEDKEEEIIGSGRLDIEEEIGVTVEVGAKLGTDLSGHSDIIRKSILSSGNNGVEL